MGRRTMRNRAYRRSPYELMRMQNKISRAEFSSLGFSKMMRRSSHSIGRPWGIFSVEV